MDKQVILTIKRNNGASEKTIVNSVELAILTYRRERRRKAVGDRAYGANYSIDGGLTSFSI